MRVIAGKHKGRRIESFIDKKLRPTTSMAREAIFNILSHGNFAKDGDNLLHDCKVLDLYCGSGALSMEALSRGASHVVLVDIEQDHLNVARNNIRKIGEEKNATFIRANSSSPPPAIYSCDLVLIDPPYDLDLVNKSIVRADKGGWLHQGSIIVIEIGKKQDFVLPEGFELLLERKYGACKIIIIKRS